MTVPSVLLFSPFVYAMISVLHRGPDFALFAAETVVINNRKMSSGGVVEVSMGVCVLLTV